MVVQKEMQLEKRKEGNRNNSYVAVYGQLIVVGGPQRRLFPMYSTREQSRNAVGIRNG